jgi:ubiquinone/menaquinone biosynthesis C-methylase UbiE
MDGLYLFDVDKALQIVGDGREPVELEPDDVRFSVNTYPVSRDHVGHVDASRPGILAHVWYPAEQGTTIQGHRLIDGHHRAARCLDEGVPFLAYLLSEQESRAVLLMGPDDARLPAAAETVDASEHNRRAWNNLVARKQRFTRTATDEELARDRRNPWLDEGVSGKRMLLLGAGGGYLSMLRASAGAVVTVVDLSDDMLALDQEQAAARGLAVRTVQASMDDLAVLPDASFDIVEQPVSTCYVPDVVAVYRQVARVLVGGGVYISHHKQPTSLQCSVRPNAAGHYELTEPYYRQGPLPPVVGSRHREAGTLEFLHRWEKLLGGLCRSGFVIEDLFEVKRGQTDAAPGSFEHRSLYVAPYVAVKARRRS